MLVMTGCYPALSIQIHNPAAKSSELCREGKIVKENYSNKEEGHDRVNKTQNKAVQKRIETSSHQGLRLMQWDQCKLN
jgi:hypothetical protein